MSKKGVESFPFFLFLTLLIAAFVITIGFYQIQTFSEFSSKRDLTNSYNNMINTMKNMRLTSDEGTFTRIELKIPSNYNITLSAINDTIELKGPNLNLNNSLELDILNLTDKYRNPKEKLTLKEGTYQIVIYYGNTTQETKPFEIFFV